MNIYIYIYNKNIDRSYNMFPITSASSGSSSCTTLASTFLRLLPRWNKCTCLVARSNTPLDSIHSYEMIKLIMIIYIVMR